MLFGCRARVPPAEDDMLKRSPVAGFDLLRKGIKRMEYDAWS